MYPKLFSMTYAASVAVVDEHAPRWKQAWKLPWEAASCSRSLQKFVGGHIVFKGKRGEIAPFFVIAEMIADDDPGDAARIQFMNESASDKAGGACDEHATF